MLSAAALGLYYVLSSKRKVMAFALLATLALATWFAMPQRYQERYVSVERYAEGSQLDSSNQLRLRIWKAGVRMFEEHPLLGVGAGQFPTAYGSIYSGRKHGAWMNPHNLLIQVGAELGVVGLVAFAFFVVQIVKANRFVLQLEDQEDLEINCQLAVACYAMLMGVVVLSCLAHTMYRPYWYLLAGFVSANQAIALHGLQSQPGVSTEVGDAQGEVAVSAQPMVSYWITETGK
jgi:O-antigen ligase